MSSQYNLFNVLQTALQWWKQLFAAVLITIAAVYTVTLPQILPPVYEAETVIYPTDPALTDKSYLMQTPGHKIDYFGRRFDFDRLHAIAESPPLIRSVIRQLNLFEYYNIDTVMQKKPMHKAVQMFRDHYSVFINEKKGLEIRFRAEDPDLAAKVVNRVVSTVDRRNRALIYSKRQEAKSVLQNEIELKREKVGKLKDSITALRTQHHLLSTKRQTVGEILLLEYLKNDTKDWSLADFIAKHDYRGAVKANEQLFILRTELNHLLDELKQLKTAHEQFRVSTSDNLSTIYTLHKAHPPEQPANNRWLQIIGSGLVVLFIGVLLANLVTGSNVQKR